MFAIDDVITGALVNVLALAGRRLTIAASDFRNRKYADALDLARWFSVRQLAQTLPDLSGLPDETAGELAAILRGDEAQAALQELLAARLTDAAELYTTTARATLTRTLAVADPALPGVVAVRCSRRPRPGDRTRADRPDGRVPAVWFRIRRRCAGRSARIR
jgi:hypothetical protein